jgi:hypothetical protein
VRRFTELPANQDLLFMTFGIFILRINYRDYPVSIRQFPGSNCVPFVSSPSPSLRIPNFPLCYNKKTLASMAVSMSELTKWKTNAPNSALISPFTVAFSYD